MHHTNEEVPSSSLHDNHDPRIAVDTIDHQGRNIINFEKIAQLEEDTLSPDLLLSGPPSAGLPPPPRANNRIPKVTTRSKPTAPAIPPDALRGSIAGPSSVWSPYNTAAATSHLHHHQYKLLVSRRAASPFAYFYHQGPGLRRCQRGT